MVSLLESCLQHDLKPSKKDEDPPHAKIVGDLVSCIFLNHGKKSLMKIAIPVAVKLLHRGNRELSRNLSSYLSIAVLQNAEILANHIQPIIDSIIGGNYSLVRVLPRIYSVRKEAIHDHVMALVCLLPSCEPPEKLSLLNLFALISKNNASILESNLPQLSECLAQPQTASPTLQIFLDMAQINPKPFGEYTGKVVAACDQNGMLWMAAQFLGIVGKLSIDQAYDCVAFLVFKLAESDLSTTITLLREIKSIVEFFPSILPSFMHKILRETEGSSSSTVQNYLHTLHVINHQISDIRSGQGANSNGSNNHFDDSMKGDGKFNTSTGSGHYSNIDSIMSPSSHGKESYGNICSGSSIYHRGFSHGTNESNNYSSNTTALQRHYSSSSNGFHRSLNAFNSHSYSSSRHQISRRSTESIMTGTNAASSQKSASSSFLLAMHDKEMSSKTVGTSVDSHLQQSLSGPVSSPSGPSSSIYSSHYTNLKLSNSLNSKIKDLKISNASYICNEHFKQSRSSFTDTSSTRDPIQHFCEKHFDKIKLYMQKISVKLPLPVRCTIEEKKAKKIARLHFVCGGKGSNCLYNKNYFTMKTRNARIWIHIMFLALQSKSNACTSEPSVVDLKKCWDTIKTDNRTFLTLVTSSFPSAKDQDILINELRSSRYFDIFEFNALANIWGCFLCNHPDRANEFLQESEPIIEGHLKEKKSGKWKLFRRWRTHYFTLSGLHLSYRETVS